MTDTATVEAYGRPFLIFNHLKDPLLRVTDPNTQLEGVSIDQSLHIFLQMHSFTNVKDLYAILRGRLSNEANRIIDSEFRIMD